MAVTEYSKSFSESDSLLTKKRQFNHPSEDYVNYISTDLLAQMMISTQNDGQKSGR